MASSSIDPAGSAIDLVSSAQILENEDPEPRLGMEAEEVFLSRKRRSPLPDWYFPRRPLQDITAMVINAREGGESQALGTKFLPEITQTAKKGDLITVKRRMPGSQSQSKRPKQSISTVSGVPKTPSITPPSLRVLKSFR